MVKATEGKAALSEDHSRKIKTVLNIRCKRRQHYVIHHPGSLGR